MPYFKPYIDESGLHIPTYNQIKEGLLEGFKGIYGDDVYLGNDSQDYEFIVFLSDKIHECFQAVELAYNNRSPGSAIGAALDGLVKLNGLRRKKKTKSTCTVTIRGAPDIKIVNGIISDCYNFNWDLPGSITIDSNGVAQATATCQEFDHWVAAGEINNIVTPTKGWQSVINNTDALAGQKFESDPMLRARQAISTTKPSRTVLEATCGGIAEIDNVTRYRVYENDKDTTDENGILAHHISVIVEGGNDYDIANEIYLRKTPGCGTFGDVAVNIYAGEIYGMPKEIPIYFFRPVYKDIFVTVHVKKLYRYVSTITDDIQKLIAEYLNNIQIGDDLTISALWGVAMSAMTDITAPSFSIIGIKAGLSKDSKSNQDIKILFNQVIRGYLENIEVIVF